MSKRPSAPVPPADGATPIDDDELAGWARSWHWNDCAGEPRDPSIYFRDMRMLKAFIAYCERIRVPSGTGAAEPVTQPLSQTIQGPEKLTNDAIPPVRGDREQVEAIIKKMLQVVHDDNRCTEWESAVKTAIDTLSLPVQPGAGEREAEPDNDTLFNLCSDCPPDGYENNRTRCASCPRRSASRQAPHSSRETES
jgi:hypothetical protein